MCSGRARAKGPGQGGEKIARKRGSHVAGRSHVCQRVRVWLMWRGNKWLEARCEWHGRESTERKHNFIKSSQSLKNYSEREWIYVYALKKCVMENEGQWNNNKTENLKKENIDIYWMTTGGPVPGKLWVSFILPIWSRAAGAPPHGPSAAHPKHSRKLHDAQVASVMYSFRIFRGSHLFLTYRHV